MRRVVQRIALWFKIGWQWLTGAPRYCGALLCGLVAIGAMIAIGHNGSESVSQPSGTVTQTGGVVPAQNLAAPSESAPSGAKNRLPENSIGNAEVVLSAVNSDYRSRKKGPSPRAIVSDRSFLVAHAEKEKTAIQDQDEKKKTARKPAKKTQRRAASEKDRKFSPSQEIKRARDEIARVIDRVL